MLIRTCSSRPVLILVALLFDGLWGLLGNFLLVPAVRADYIHQTLAAREGTILELHVGEKAIEARFEIDAADRVFFQNLLRVGSTASGADSFALLDAASGHPLPGSIVQVETRRRTPRYDSKAPLPTNAIGEPLELPEVSPLVTFARLSYPLPKLPTEIILRPPMGKGGEFSTTAIGFIVFHENLPVINYGYFSRPEKLLLDPYDPWKSRFQNQNLKRAHSSSLTSYLTVEPFEVRHEVVVRLLDLSPLLGLKLAPDETLDEAKLAVIKQRTRDFFNSRPRTIIDGLHRKGGVIDVSLLSVDHQGIFQRKANDAEHKPFSTLLGVSLSFPNEATARSVEVSWNLFSQRIPSIAAQATDSAGPFPAVLTADSPTLRWDNVLQRQPEAELQHVRVENRWWIGLAAYCLCILVITVVLVVAYRSGRIQQHVKGGSKGVLICSTSLAVALFCWAMLQAAHSHHWSLTNGHAGRLIEQLLANVYRAMEFREEDQVYDRLAISLQKDTLTDVYLQQRRSMAKRDVDGARSRVQRVNVQAVRRLGWPVWGETTRYQVIWTASGTVSHWGHTHQRQNQYEAQTGLSRSGDVWKIGNLIMLDEVRSP